MNDQSIFDVEPWSVTERELRLDLLPYTETVFALSNGHIGLRGNLDEGEPHVVPGSYLNGFFETVPLPYAESGYGYPANGQIADRRDQRQGHSSAGGRRAVRHPLRRLAASRARARPARGRAAPRSGVDIAGRPVGARALDAAGVVCPARRCRDLLRGPGAGGPDARRRAVHARGERGPPGRPTIRARRSRCAARWCASTTPTTIWKPRSAIAHGSAGCAWRPPWTTSSKPRRARSPVRERARPGAHQRQHRAGAGPDAAADQVRRVWLVERRSQPALRDQVDAALPRPGGPAGTGCCAQPARVPR